MEKYYTDPVHRIEEAAIFSGKSCFMARVQNNPILKGVTGKLGNTHVYRQLANGMTVMANMPAERKKISEKQKANNERFRCAARYAKGRMADPADKAEYKTGVTYNKSTPYRVALTDWLHAPVVHYIKAYGYTGAAGDLISIKATDDFKVIAVDVVITGADGAILEQGSAEKNSRKRFMWKYRTTVANPHPTGTKIKVTAWDKPKNRTERELVF